jgi:lipopolysaccharide export system protein LptA
MSADRPTFRLRNTLAWAVLAVALLWPPLSLPAEDPKIPLISPDAGLPIDLQAASSQLDGQSRTLTFQKVRITQGTMTIEADRGEAARLDFDNSRWRFEGSVVLNNQGARVECDSAEMQFEGHELRSAVLRGAPVRLEQPRARSTVPTRGSANLMEYDVRVGTIRLIDNANLTDGANEVSGERITYDLRREFVTADSSGSGQVRMKIQPPSRPPKKGTAP